VEKELNVMKRSAMWHHKNIMYSADMIKKIHTRRDASEE
jgi:hypothetical protein